MIHYHYTGWPDFGVPSGDAVDDFESMLAIANDKLALMSESNSKEKMVIHCSAGVGRTGTFISLMHLMITLSAQRNMNLTRQVSIFNTVLTLR